MKVTLSLLILIAATFALAVDGRDDYSAFSFTSQQGLDSESIILHSGNAAEALWAYTTLPSLTVGNKSLYIAIEAELFHHDLNLSGVAQERSLFQRYGLFAGLPVVELTKQKGSVYASLGVASDFSRLSRRDLYWQLIYDHRITISDRLTVGMGILYSYAHGGPKRSNPINLLPTLRWRFHDRWKLSMNWDNLELRYFATERLSFVGEGRYDMSWFNLEEVSYQVEDVSLGGGVDLKVASNLFLRVRALKGMYRREILWDDDEEWTFTPGESSGFALRVMLSMVK